MENCMNHINAIERLEELRILMKKVHKQKDDPYRRAEFQAMMFLMTKKKITMQELGEELGVTKPRITALVNELMAKNYVVQSSDEHDRRKKYISLSKLGFEHMEHHKNLYEQWFEKIWNKFDSREKESFEIVISKVNKIMKEEIGGN